MALPVLGSVASVMTSMRAGTPLREVARKARLEHQRLLRASALEERFRASASSTRPDHAEEAAGAEAVAQRDRRVVGRRVDDGEPDVPDVGAEAIAEQDHLQQRQERSAPSACGGRGGCGSTSLRSRPQQRISWPPLYRVGRGAVGSRQADEHVVDRRDGELSFQLSRRSEAPIRPSTMIDTRSQYSASSM